MNLALAIGLAGIVAVGFYAWDIGRLSARVVVLLSAMVFEFGVLRICGSIIYSLRNDRNGRGC